MVQKVSYKSIMKKIKARLLNLTLIMAMALTMISFNVSAATPPELVGEQTVNVELWNSGATAASSEWVEPVATIKTVDGVSTMTINMQGAVQGAMMSYLMDVTVDGSYTDAVAGELDENGFATTFSFPITPGTVDDDGIEMLRIGVKYIVHPENPAFPFPNGHAITQHLRIDWDSLSSKGSSNLPMLTGKQTVDVVLWNSGGTAPSSEWILPTATIVTADGVSMMTIKAQGATQGAMTAFLKDFTVDGSYTDVILGEEDEDGFPSSYTFLITQGAVDERGVEMLRVNITYLPVPMPDNFPFKDGHSVAQNLRIDWMTLVEAETNQESWVQDAIGWRYQLEEGIFLTNDWQKDGLYWYYLGEDGYMQTGWIQDGETWYYLAPNGAMQTGWINRGKWYYLGADGSLQTGWIQDGEDRYFLDKTSGTIVTGWVQDGEDWYFMSYETGIMQINTWIGNYWVGEEGKWVSDN